MKKLLNLAGFVASSFILLSGCSSPTPSTGDFEPAPSLAIINTVVANETDGATHRDPKPGNSQEAPAPTSSLGIITPERTPQRLTQEMANETVGPIQGVWSPDSSHVAYYSSHHGGVRTQAIIDLEGNIEMELTHGIGPFFFVLPSWSADGDQIAYTVNGECCEFEDGAAVEIEVASSNGENRKQATMTKGEDLVVPRYLNWIEYDSRLLYSSNYREETSLPTGIFTVESTGGVPKLILREADQPDVCKIDFKVVYAYRWGGIRIANTDGSNEEILIEDPTLTGGPSPKWSPDCEHIVYRTISPYRTELRVLRLDGADYTIVQTHLGNSIQQFDWSPDGQHIVFDQLFDGFNWDIMVLSIETGETHRLSTDEADDKFPSWSPDGSKILFTSNREGGAYDLYLLDVSEGFDS